MEEEEREGGSPGRRREGAHADGARGWVMRPQTKGCLEPPAAGDKERSSPQALGGDMALRPLHFGLLASSTGRDHSRGCKSPVCGTWLHGPGPSHALFTALTSATTLTGTPCWAQQHRSHPAGHKPGPGAITSQQKSR